MRVFIQGRSTEQIIGGGGGGGGGGSSRKSFFNLRVIDWVKPTLPTLGNDSIINDMQPFSVHSIYNTSSLQGDFAIFVKN